MLVGVFVLFVRACARLPLSSLLLLWQFEDFFEEVYQELSKFGEISEMNVCDNLGDHLIGNVYVKVRCFSNSGVSTGSNVRTSCALFFFTSYGWSSCRPIKTLISDDKKKTVSLVLLLA